MKKTPFWGKRNINVSTNLRKVSQKKKKFISQVNMGYVMKMMDEVEESAYEV